LSSYFPLFLSITSLQNRVFWYVSKKLFHFADENQDYRENNLKKLGFLHSTTWKSANTFLKDTPLFPRNAMRRW